MRESIKISDAEAKAKYDERKAQLERAKARHILIAFQGSPAAPAEGALTDDAAKAKAEEIRTKIANGADFVALAKAESHDTVSGANGGDLGELSRGQMVPEFDQAVFTAKAGELTPVVRGWITDPDRWLRRTSVICQLASREETDLALLHDSVEANLHDPDFALDNRPVFVGNVFLSSTTAGPCSAVPAASA